MPRSRCSPPTDGRPSARGGCASRGAHAPYFYESFADGAGLRSEVVRRAVCAGLDVVASPLSKGRFLAASLTAGSSIAAHRACSIDDLAAIIEAALSTHRGDRPIASRQARITAIIAVGAILSIIDSWLTHQVDLTQEEVVSWSATAATGIINAVAAGTQ
jgi:hypothetical protein